MACFAGAGSAFLVAAGFAAFVAVFFSGVGCVTCGPDGSAWMASTPNPAPRKHRRLWQSKGNGTRIFLDVVGRHPAEMPVLRIKWVLEKGPIASSLNHALEIVLAC